MSMNEQSSSLYHDTKLYYATHGINFLKPEYTLHPVGITLSPCTALTEAEYERMENLTSAINILYAKVLRDKEFIKESLQEMAKADDLMQGLMDMLDDSYGLDEQMYVSRCDYMIDSETNFPLLIEINMVSVGCTHLAPTVQRLHKFTHRYQEELKPIINRADDNWVSAMNSLMLKYDNPDASLLMICLDGELNQFDQYLMMTDLYEKHGIKPLRCTRSQISEITFDEENRVFFRGNEIGIIYWRTFYNHHQTTPEFWDLRRKLEKSKAYCVPTAAAQLIGSKYMQATLSNPDIVRKYLSCYTEEEIQEVASSLGHGISHTVTPEFTQHKDMKNFVMYPERWVLKPQGEGGSNNFFGMDGIVRLGLTDLHESLKADPTLEIAEELRNRFADDWNQFVLMKWIKPTVFDAEFLIGDKLTHYEDAIFELGIFNTTFVPHSSDESIITRSDGYLLRTKRKDDREGGMAVGISMLDSLAIAE
ncbi:hypothetical protein PCE1_001637 [Barthelona sp. PCE]